MDPVQVRTLCSLYARTKELMLLAEEVDDRQQTFLQPSLELKAALDHLMRSMSAEHGLLQGEASDYPDKHVAKAISHVYRAFFDTADWLSMSLRDAIEDALEPFSSESIIAVIPEYYSDVKPRLIHNNERIASFRARKDIGKDADGLFSEYCALIESLRTDHRLIIARIGAMVDHRTRAENGSRNERVFQILLVLLGCALGAALTYYFSP